MKAKNLRPGHKIIAEIEKPSLFGKPRMVSEVSTVVSVTKSETKVLSSTGTVAFGLDVVYEDGSYSFLHPDEEVALQR